MSQRKIFKRGDILLHQGASPQYFCIMLKGLAKVYKRPNRTEMISEKLK